MQNEVWSPVVPTGRREALVEEFPRYLREAIFQWMHDSLESSSGFVSTEFLINFQNASRVDIGFQSNRYLNWNDQLLPYLREIDDAIFTNLLDYLASSTPFEPGTEHPLEYILSEGGSAWTIMRWNDIYARLTRRVPEGVTEAFHDVLRATDRASRKLQEAWLDAYGANPRASVAYSNAVVAVETAALTVIPVNKQDATLANLFSILEAEKPKWQLVLRDSDKAPGAKSLAAMLRTLWRGHQSRHGRPDYTDATLEEARAAVVLAATLVQWFTSGVIKPA
mgnify:FL=1